MNNPFQVRWHEHDMTKENIFLPNCNQTSTFNRPSGKVSMKRRPEESPMAEKMKCEYCEKDAIGYQGYGCCSAYVCLDHADSFVLALKPGESLTSGNAILSGSLSRIESAPTFPHHHIYACAGLRVSKFLPVWSWRIHSVPGSY